MNSRGTPPDLIRLLAKPLRYAAGLPAERLAQVMPNIEASVRQILDAHSAAAPALDPFRQMLMGLDGLPPDQRRARVAELLAMLDRMEEGGPGPEAPRRPEKPSAGEGLTKDIKFVKGVGPRMAERFERLKIFTVHDLLYHLPSRYDDRRGLVAIAALAPGRRATIAGQIMACGPAQARFQRQYHLLISDGTATVNAIWFRYAGDWLEKRFHRDQRVIATGPVGSYQGALQMTHPEVTIVEDGEDEITAGVVPVYPATEGMSQYYLRRIAAQAISDLPDEIPDLLPPALSSRRKLPDPGRAFRLVHAPPNDADLAEYNEHRSPAHRRLVYEEFFLLQLALARRRQGVALETAAPVAARGDLIERFRRELGFGFTRDQDKALAEIAADLARPHPMHRLLHGEVGSGKTVVALAAALAAVSCGYQSALMAPTELLAEQHYRTAGPALERLGVRAELLTGRVKGPARAEALAGVGSGAVKLLIGTHAVIQEQVKFKGLALAVIDEQHRFGVLQRARLKAKGPAGTAPHLLVMTATPIPRSLAMTVYGDLAVSVIRELPPGRSPIRTRLFKDSERAKVYELMRGEVKSGGQVFVVYPLIEESEKLDLKDAVSMYEDFRARIFPDLRVGLAHGRMRGDEREAVMGAFAAGGLDVLVATTVIEVGIDVPNASVMVVENAERFGLSQLHQLRGRVGRGGRESQCVLVSAFTRSEDAWRRLKVMEQTSDGFKIAEEDLAIRGPGEFFGTRQSGLPDFRVANIIRDAEVLSEAREDAFDLIARDPDLIRPEHRELKAAVASRWGKRLKLGRVG